MSINASTLRFFRYSSIVRNRPDGPDFIVAGLMKTSTSWLYSVLSKNQSFNMPLTKELLFFTYLSNQELPDGNNKRLIDRMQERIASAQLDFVENSSSWNSDYRDFHELKLKNFVANPFTREWYEGLFLPTSPHKPSGDITPSYALLPKQYLSDIKSDYDPKVVLIFRNPLDRFWSGLKMLVSESGVSLDDHSAVMNIVTNRFKSVSLDYREVYENYSQVFGESLAIFSYEDIHKNPQGFFDSFCAHVGASKSEIGLTAQNVVYQTPKTPMPKWLYEYAVDTQLESRLFMREYFPEHVEGWQCDTSITNAKVTP